jgi:hypothetical protein
MSEAHYGGSAGPSTDRYNDPVIDPTKNVLDLVAADAKRQDDLRALDSSWRDKFNARDREHAKEIRQAESARIDAIRAVDVENVRQRAVEAEQRASTLANTVAATATAFDAKLVTELDPLKKDIADLRRAQYEALGGKAQGLDTRSVLAAIVAVLVLGVLAYGTFGKKAPAGANETIVCTASYHPAPCP